MASPVGSAPRRVPSRPPSGLTAALLSSSQEDHEARIDVAPPARGSAHSFTSLGDADGAGGPSPDNAFLVGSPWGGPRSGASLFLRPNRVAPASTYRTSLDETMHSMSRTYSISEVPQLEAAASAGLSSTDAGQPLLGALPPPSAASNLPKSHTTSSAKPESRGEPPGFEAEGKSVATARARSLYTAVLYGLINGIVGLPTMISFVAIIFKDPTYSKYLSQLAKLGFFASGVHQAAFAIFSTLPYAVGQVQDVGLIFLSSMATSIAALCASAGPGVAMGTSLTWLAFSTFTVGLCIVAVGKKKLATLVQYIPIQVVGAYLGYVGYFCIAAGVGLGVGKDIGSIVSWRLLADKDALIKLGPTLAAALALLLALKCSRNPLALPAVLVVIPGIFHIVRLIMGCTMDDAIASGWLLSGAGSDRPFWSVYELYNWQLDGWKLEGVQWSAMPRQIPSLIALFLVVTFGSALDVAAIQQDTPWPLDFNQELVTVGISNVVAGAVGAGMTGSYIFSQTIFSMRAGVDNRLHGAIIAAMELALFFLPISIIQYMPTYFYGSLLVLFGIDISNDWLIHSASKVTRAEYILLLLSFLAILQTGLEVGILAGIIASTFYFAFCYARANMAAFTIQSSRSGVMRTWDQRLILDVFTEHMVTISMSGYMFFGSALAVSDRVLHVVNDMLERDMAEAGRAIAGRVRERAADGSALADASGGDGRLLEDRAHAALSTCPRFVLLDFKRVQGLDATAARTIGTLHGTLQGRGVQMLVACLTSRETARLLRAHGVPLVDSEVAAPPGVCHCFPSLDAGLEFCERAYLQVAAEEGLCQLNQQTMSLADILRSHLQQPQALFSAAVDADRAARDLQRVMKRRQLAPQEPLFTAGSPSEELYFIITGTLTLTLSFDSDGNARPPLPGQQRAAGTVDRVFTYGPGTILGQVDFFLGNRPRTATAVAGSDPCTVFVVPRAAFDTLRIKSPEALIILTTAMLRSATTTEMHAVETLGARQG